LIENAKRWRPIPNWDQIKLIYTSQSSMQMNVMHENNAAAQPLPGQIDNDDEYENEDHDNEIDMIELNTAYNH
jgi:hypothetical protein